MGRITVEQDTNFKIALGQRIHLLRVSKGISISALARRCGMTYPHLWKIEQGKIDPTASTLIRIMMRLRATPKQFFEGMRLRQFLRDGDF